MVDGRRVLAVVPARGGSKGVPLKNIHELCGIPLIAHVASLLKELPCVDRSVVSTDHPQILGTAVSCGLDGPFLRPPELSGDLIGDYDVLRHALAECERIDGCQYDIVIMLQPTSPLRRSLHVRQALEMLVSGGWDAVWTVSPTDLKYHPLKQLEVHDGAMDYFDPRGAGIIARQQLVPVYHRNGAAYVLTRDCIIEQKTIKGRRTGALVIESPMISIDTLDDFARAEKAMDETR
ncbi:MAG: acylneuraminate cytidylyltransferase family protein [Gemmatimonadota bacterium]